METASRYTNDRNLPFHGALEHQASQVFEVCQSRFCRVSFRTLVNLDLADH